MNIHLCQLNLQSRNDFKLVLVESTYPLYVMLGTNFRVVEELDNGDKVITYFQVQMIDKKFYYVYNDVNHGPFDDVDDAVQAAYEDLIPQSVSE